MIKLFVIISVFSIMHPSSAREMGPGGSGGGDYLIAGFIQIAANIKEKVPFSREDRLLIEGTLKNTKIIVVDELKNPLTLDPIPNQSSLMAYGSKGLIQLKNSEGGNHSASWESSYLRGESLAAFVIHEIWRASGRVDERGLSPDENFEITIGKYRLDKISNSGNSIPEEILHPIEIFTRLNCKNSRGENLDWKMLVNATPSISSPGLISNGLDQLRLVSKNNSSISNNEIQLSGATYNFFEEYTEVHGHNINDLSSITDIRIRLFRDLEIAVQDIQFKGKEIFGPASIIITKKDGTSDLYEMDCSILTTL